MEELNWGCAGIATGLIGAGLAYLPIIRMGSEQQKERIPSTVLRAEGEACADAAGIVPN